jgi:hypothetical protein
MLRRVAVAALCLIVGLVGGVLLSRQFRALYDHSIAVCVAQRDGQPASVRLGDSGCVPDEIAICVDAKSELLDPDSIRVSADPSEGAALQRGRGVGPLTESC